jgi:GNAT superfamily N-acetyltransferase
LPHTGPGSLSGVAASGDLRVELVRPDGPVGVEEWFRPLLAVDTADRPGDPGWFLHERVALLDQPGVLAHVLGVARVGDVCGSFQVRMSLRENVHDADIEVWVDPARWGRGVGRALLQRAEELARGRGRTHLHGTTEAPLGSPERDRRHRFARAAGYAPALEEERRELALAVDPARLRRLEEDARRHAAGYRLVEWTGPCPREWEHGRLEVGRRMSTDAPQGDLEVEAEAWDAARLRQVERVVAAMDRATSTSAAVAPDGTLVGYTELAVPRATPALAYQFDTIVLPAHRGKRLGLLLKVVNLRALQVRSPATRRVVTMNAASNAPMIRVNEQLGFRVTGTATVWKKRLG